MRTLTTDSIQAASVMPDGDTINFIDIDGTVILTLIPKVKYGDNVVMTEQGELYKLDSYLRLNEIIIPGVVWALNRKLNGFGITIKAVGLYYLDQIKNKVYIGTVELK